jgi:hypothetical protein
MGLWLPVNSVNCGMTDAEDKNKPDTAGEPVQPYKRIQVFRSWQEAEDADVADLAARSPETSLQMANLLISRIFHDQLALSRGLGNRIYFNNEE